MLMNVMNDAQSSYQKCLLKTKANDWKYFILELDYSDTARNHLIKNSIFHFVYYYFTGLNNRDNKC